MHWSKKTTAATGEANLADIVKPHPGVVPTGECSHLRRHHPLLSEIQEQFHKHLPTSTQSKPTGSQGIDEQHLDFSMQDTETQHDQGVKRKFPEQPDTPSKKVYVPLQPTECHCELFFQSAL